MSYYYYHENAFQNNLQHSFICLKDKNLEGFWLNRDGTFSLKNSWFGRVVRWIFNLLCNKTTADIWHVFKKAAIEFDEGRKSTLDLKIKDVKLVDEANAFLLQRSVRLNFALSFLLSRKSGVDRWLKNNPDERRNLKKLFEDYQSWLAGLAHDEENKLQLEAAQHLVTKLEKVLLPSITKKALRKPPPPLQLAISPETDLLQYQQFDIEELGKIGGESDSLNKMLKKIKSRDDKVFGVNANIREKYFDQIELYLKNILYEIRNNDKISKEKKSAVLIELSKAADECGPRWLEESCKQHRYLALNSTVLEAKILEHVQALKEDLFIELFQKSANVEYHILDSFRKEYGKKFGLNEDTVDLDVFAYKVPKRLLDRLSKIFLNSFSGHRLVHGLKERINLELSESWDPSYLTYLSNAVQRHMPQLEDPSGYVYENLMEQDKKGLNTQGVVFLLQWHGFLQS